MKRSGNTNGKPKLLPQRASFLNRKSIALSCPKTGKHHSKGELFLRIISRVAMWLAVLLLVIILFFDQLAFWTITTIGSRITGTEITMDDLEISLTRGDIKITNLRLSNPDGFDENSMIEVASLYFKIDKSSLFSGEITVTDIELHRGNIYGMITPEGNFNLQILTDRLREWSNHDDRDERTFIIKNILLEKFKLHMVDQRTQNPVDGFEINVEKFYGTISSGHFTLESLNILPPRLIGSSLLELDHADITFSPESISGGKPEISSLNTDGLRLALPTSTDSYPYFREIAGIFSKLLSGSDNQERTAGNMPLLIENFTFKNSSAVIRENNGDTPENIFGIRLGEINGNWQDGEVRLSAMLITSPRGYSGNMLKLDSARITFVPESLFTDSPVFENIKVENLTITAEISPRNHSNIEIAVNTLRRVFFPTAPAVEFTSGTDPVINNFDIVNAAITVTDHRTLATGNINGLRISFRRMHGSWDNGNVTLDSLSITNPTGYSDYMLQIKTLSAGFDPESFTRPTTIIHDITIDSLHATACINENGNSNFRDVKTAFELLFSPLISEKAPACDSAANRNSPPVIRITGYNLENCQLVIRDARSAGKADAVSVYLRQLLFSQEQRLWQLTDMRFTSPPGYTRPYVATVASISAEFPEEPAENGDFIIEKLTIDGAHGCAEYNADGELNAGHITAAFCIIFEGEISGSEESAARSTSAGNDDQPRFKTVIRNYQLKNSSFSLWDAKTAVPIQIPLQQNETDYTIESSDLSIFASMHNQTVELGEKLAGVTDAQNLLLYFLNKTAGSGVDLLLKTGDSGIQIFRDMLAPIL